MASCFASRVAIAVDIVKDLDELDLVIICSADRDLIPIVDYIRDMNRIKFDKVDYFPEEGFKKGQKILEDNGIVSGIDLVAACVEIFEIHKIKCEVLAASIRNPRQFREAAGAGAHIATVPLSVIKKLLNHPKTIEGMKKFTKDVVPEYSKILKKK